MYPLVWRNHSQLSINSSLDFDLVGLHFSRWWFQRFVIFTPKIGEDEPSLTSIFFNGVGFNHQRVQKLRTTWGFFQPQKDNPERFPRCQPQNYLKKNIIPALKLHGMSFWVSSCHLFQGPRGVMNGGSGVSIGGVRSLREGRIVSGDRITPPFYKPWKYLGHGWKGVPFQPQVLGDENDHHGQMNLTMHFRYLGWILRVSTLIWDFSQFVCHSTGGFCAQRNGATLRGENEFLIFGFLVQRPVKN